MDIYAAGFNAWNQLSFDAPADSIAEPQDISTFTKVLGNDHFGRPRAGLHYTIVRGSARYHFAGTGVDVADDDEALRDLYESCVAGNGLTLAIHSARASAEKEDVSLEPNQPSLAIYPSFSDFKSESNSTIHSCKGRIRDVVAFDAGFLILYEDGTVATLGDPRYQDCLAREVIPEAPANKPGLVPDLIHLEDPIKHITAGGYCLAALTESGSVYIWGRGSTGQRHTGHSTFLELNGIPNYCEVDGDKDVQDVAIGESHAIALTTDGVVYVIGRNHNGQLGLGQGSDTVVKTWMKVPLDIPDGYQVKGVAAGPRSSFILTARRTHAA